MRTPNDDTLTCHRCKRECYEDEGDVNLIGEFVCWECWRKTTSLTEGTGAA
jgi:hypothetical protein